MGEVEQAAERYRISFGRRIHSVTLLTRGEADEARDRIHWDGESLGGWTDAIEGSDVVVNLAGRSVDCRYTEENLRAMLDSRVLSTRVVGQAIELVRQVASIGEL